jgi:hypothetical protein
MRRRPTVLAAAAAWLLGVAAVAGAAPASSHAPLALHPDNPRYFLFHGKPTVLVTSGEHYGAVLNLDFDYVRYLDALAKDGLNLTRLFSGTYREVPSSFGITDNTLAPKPGRYAAPWARSTVPGDYDGGMKFDLSRGDESYFRRLKDFMAEAHERGVVVEMNLFCPFYEEVLWAASPMNARNNVNGIGKAPRDEVYTLKHADLTAAQEAVVRRIVTELNPFDNLYFEVANEPYVGGITLAWQHHVATLIAETEAKLPKRHLVSMNIANWSARVESPSLHVSIFNFHYATPPDAVAMNAHLRGVIGENETGFRGKDDVLYRTEGWAFLLAGGGLFNNLDYSFTPAHPDGTFLEYSSPGGGSPTFRKQMRVLKDFVHSFDFVRMRPDTSVVAAPAGLTVQALVETGRQYAVYLHAPVGAGGFAARWTGRLDPPVTGRYRLTTVSDDGVRLWLDGKLLIENWIDHAATEDHATVELVAGRPSDLRVEYYQGGGGATARLKWTRPDGTTEIVPADRLLLPDGSGPGLRAEYFEGRTFDEPEAVRMEGTIDFEWPPLPRPIARPAPREPVEVALELPAGRYQAEWTDPKTGSVTKSEALDHAGGRKSLVSPAFDEDVALAIKARP